MNAPGHRLQIKPPIMRFDFTGAELFLDYWAGQATARQVLDHPAYQTVCRHAQFFGGGISEQDVETARLGQPSAFYGLDGLSARLPRLRAFLGLLRTRTRAWATSARRNLERLFPGEDLNITIYPIIGYDMGIGLSGAVCLNCNYEPYLADPCEFLFFIIHEGVHVVYERYHRVPSLGEVNSSADWCSYFKLWMQNEGYAVYAPLRLRQGLGRLAERDYRVLFNAAELELHRVALLGALDRLQSDRPLRAEEYPEYCFGSQRLTYRLGCELIRRLDRMGGVEAVRSAFFLDGDTFVDTYLHLLEASA